jgi:hypothetical protein
VTVIVLLLGGCVVGAPPGFSPGEAWTFPLVDPLAKEPLITPVMIGGKGPFLFVLDPDAATGIDIEVISQISTVGNAGYWAPLTGVQVGTLHVDSLPFLARKQHTFDVGGRRIYGVIGREVFTSGLVFGFDRDRGIAWLATPRHAQLPANARVLEYWTRHGAPALPDLEVDLGTGAERFAVALEDRYTDAFEVIDASPFPRTCVDGTECVVPAP